MAPAGFDFTALRQALQRGDPAALAALYAEDAEMTIIDRHRPPSTPLRLHGRAAIAGFWRQACGGDAQHALEAAVVGDDRIAFVERRAWPDGGQAMAAVTLDVREGRIARHLMVQAWDEA